MINSGTELIKILIIEDDEAHSELIARSFEDHQTTFNLMFKTNLKESRQYLEENQPQIVLCDWMLPDGKGLDIFPQDPTQIPFPIVVMTSYGTEMLILDSAEDESEGEEFDKSFAMMDYFPSLDVPALTNRVLGGGLE